MRPLTFAGVGRLRVANRILVENGKNRDILRFYLGGGHQ
jgi:hypothetical protein